MGKRVFPRAPSRKPRCFGEGAGKPAFSARGMLRFFYTSYPDGNGCKNPNADAPPYKKTGRGIVLGVANLFASYPDGAGKPGAQCALPILGGGQARFQRSGDATILLYLIPRWERLCGIERFCCRQKSFTISRIFFPSTATSPSPKEFIRLNFQSYRIAL